MNRHEGKPRLVPAVERASRILDLGCGTGSLLQHLMDEHGCTGTGVEIDPDKYPGHVLLVEKMQR